MTSFHTHFWIVLTLFLIHLFTISIPLARKYSDVFCFLSTLASGLLIAETVYRAYPLKIPPGWLNFMGEIWIFIVVLILVVYAFWKRSSQIQIPVLMLVPVFLYAGWTSLMEESIFRGFLLPTLLNRLSQRTAIITQAAVFAVIHVKPFDLKTSFLAGVLFIFLGWFFGRAAVETGGIGASYVMHTALILGIEIKLLAG